VSEKAASAKASASAEATAGKHYSYELYADPRMAESFEGMRFSGPIGRLIAESQEQVIASFLEPVAGQRVLDVGTGTGRGAIALAARGARVTGVDASAEMLAVARRRAQESGVEVDFVQGDAHGLAYDDRSFDVVLCLRVLMHTPDWRRSLGELCRVSRRYVVFDYPALLSAAALQSAARHVANAAGARTEAYRVFTDRSIRATLRANGFDVARRDRQFVLPIAVHKKVGSAGATRRVEGAFRQVGLNWLLGSPVTVLAERCAS
jgi:2-polyprenyl-3-methyl-5-hydroxy-6-metoxy-1,4-benzoquinol methylase